MSNPISSVSGLASGIQWRDLVDQIMKAESLRRLDPVKQQVSLTQKRVEAWNSFGRLVGKLNDAAKPLKEGSAFDVFGATVSNSATTNRALVTASAAAGAVPGTSKVEILSLAQTEKLSSSVYASSSTALGLSGEFVVNQKVVQLDANDSLSMVRDKINAANSGTGASRVTATILTTGQNQHRLVLSSDVAGRAGIELIDSATSGGVLAQLGVTDGTQVANSPANGGNRSHALSSVTASIAAALGIQTYPPPSTVTIDGRTITVDLTVDSLSAIAARIQAAGGSARTVQETVDGQTRHRLETSGTVGGDARTLQLLGFTVGGKSAASQSVRTDTQLQNGSNAPATAATAMSALRIGGSSAGVQTGDTISVRGSRGDGTVVDTTYTVGASDTLQSLVDRINNASDGFGAGGRTATASVVDGRIVLTDNAGGESQLALTLTANNQNGGSLTFGSSVTESTGRLRQVAAGSDAQIRIDGVLVSRRSNTISDALAGVTLNLHAAEPGTQVDLSISRDQNKQIASVKAFAAAYNELQAFVATETGQGGILAYDSSVRSAFSNFTGQFLKSIEGLGNTGYNHPALVGLTLDRFGKMEVEEKKLRGLLETNLADVRRAFQQQGLTTDSAVRFLGSTNRTQSGTYAVDITAVATKAVHASTGFAGTMAWDPNPDQMRVFDSVTGQTASINIATGDSIDDIVSALNTQFGSQGMSLAASKVGNQLRVTHLTAGTSSFDVSYTINAVDNVTQLGLPAGSYSGNAAVAGSHTGSGFQSPLGGGPAADRMFVADSLTGRTAEVDIDDTDDITTVVAKLNAGFLLEGINMVASDEGGELKIAHNVAGAHTFNVSYTIIGGDNVSAMGFAAGTYGGVAATSAQRTGSGFSGTVVNPAGADTMQIVDAFTGRTGSIQLNYGDDIDDIVTRWNAEFSAQGMQLTARRTGNELSVEHQAFGSSANFTVSHSGGGTFSSQLNFTAGIYGGQDVQGTIGGIAATGRGQTLLGETGAIEGLSLQYLGDTVRPAGDVTFIVGLAGTVMRNADLITRADNGTVSMIVDSLRDSISKLNSRASDIQFRLDARRESLIQQFTRMETLMSSLQGQSTRLSSQIQMLQPRNN